MKLLHRLLAAGLLATAACRSTANPNVFPGDDAGDAMDAAVTDTPVTPPTDNPPPDDCTPSGAENTNGACADGLDNDCDGFTDCRDFDCTRTAAVTICPATDAGSRPCDATGPENSNAACSDGVDNDCDGFRDCADFDCSRSSSVTICPRDGGTSCDATGPENTNATCGDGIDNDCDGFTDCADFSCRSCAIPACVTSGSINLPDGGTCMCRGEENTNAACGDGVDNDCDGFTDCRDFDCTRTAGVTACPTDGGAAPCDATGPENTNAACGDGIDNDCDGFRDCADFDCSRNSSVTVCPSDGGTRTCDAGGSENSNATCNDGIDNDCDGFTDCADFSCRSCAITACVTSGSITLPDGGTCMCQGAENTNTACGDGVDNDCDGFVDCRDFDCTAADAGVSVCRDGG